MAFGLAPGRGDRRRRVLTEDVISAPGAAKASADRGGAAEPARRYTEAANYANRARLSDAVPKRWLSVASLVLLGGLLLTAIVLLDRHASDWSTVVDGQHLDAVRLRNVADGPTGSCAVWLASVLLLASSLLSVIIYTLRRHRVDDYQGRYRAWLWTAAACLLLSLNTTAGLHRVAADLASHLTGWNALDGAVWWLGALGLAVATMGLRLVLEVRQCRLALLALLTAFTCWGVSIAVHFQLLPVDTTAATASVAAMLLAGHLLLLGSLTLTARHVVLEADGLAMSRLRVAAGTDTKEVQGRRSRGRQTTAGRAGSPGGIRLADTPPAATPGPATPGSARRRGVAAGPPKKKVVEWTDGSEGAGSDGDEDGLDLQSRRPSKAERKRLRKQKQRQRRAA